MDLEEFVRVVTLRRGKLKPVEFRLREGETGLSLFGRVDQPGPVEIIEAVRGAGKAGNLAVAVIPAKQIFALGLRIVPTTGRTPNVEVNAVHFEARLPFTRRLLVRLRGTKPHEFFNDQFSGRLCQIARVLHQEEGL